MANLFNQLQQQSQLRPQKIALWHCTAAGKASSVTFAQLAERSRAFASALRRHLPAGAIVPLLLGKSPDCVAAMLGVLGAGMTFACLNRKLRTPQISAILQMARPPVALVDGPGLMGLRDGASADSPLAQTHWWLVPGGALEPAHARVQQQLSRAIPLSVWGTDIVPDAHDGVPRIEEDPARPGCCLFTSGSTGAPKGVLIAHSDLCARAQAEAEWFGLTSDDVLLNILPFSFDVGLNQLLAMVVSGCTLVLLDSWLPADIFRVAGEFGVTGISAVPAIWSDMRRAGVQFDTAARHAALRYITVSGGDLPPEQLAALPVLAPGVGIYKTYGQSEAFRATCLRPDEFADRPRSVGRAFGDVRIHIVREDGGHCHAEEEGEIVHTGLGTMLGYLGGQDPEHKLRPNPFCAEGDPAPLAVYTGDLGHLDAAGYLYVHGRRDGMLKVSGNRVYPKEVSNQLTAIAGLIEAEVIGAKGEDGVTQLFGFVTLAAGAALTPPAILRALAARVPSYMVPREIVILPAMPRTASGKPDRPALAQQAQLLLVSRLTPATLAAVSGVDGKP